MAYAAVISLKQTLHRLLLSSHTSIQQILESAYNHIKSLQEILKRLDDRSSRDRLNALDKQIRDDAHNLEDLLEFHELNQSESSPDFDVKVKLGIKSFCETAAKITNDCDAEIGGHPWHEEDDDDDDDEAVPSDVKKGTDSFDYTDVYYHLTERMRPNDFGVFQITGLPGTGATIAAAAIFEDLKSCFDGSAWVRVGPRCERKGILLSILAQINKPINEFFNAKRDEEIGEYLYECLKRKRFMIVLDDICDVEIWNFLESFFPVEDNGSAVVLTTRGQQYELRQIRNSFLFYNMGCRHEESWWYLFRKWVFYLESDIFPLELEEAGKKILQNCRSGGIVVLKVILLLLKAENTLDYWNELAEDEGNPIFMVDDEFSEVP